MTHHIVPFKVYFGILMALIGLTILTVVLAPPVTGIDLGFFNVVVAVGIACTKAFLVGAYFMQLKYDDKLFTLMIISAVAFVILLFAFSVLDIYTRIIQTNPL